MVAPLKTFIIYASSDRDHRAALERQLKSLIDNGMIQLWSDKEILAGDLWDATIKNKLLESELFLMLVSTDFFNSEYIRQEEFSRALEKLERGEALVVPIIVRDCDWAAYEVIEKLQVLPHGGKAITDLRYWPNADTAWAEIVREIRRLIAALRANQASAVKIKQIQIDKEQKRTAETLARETKRREKMQVSYRPKPFLWRWAFALAGILLAATLIWKLTDDNGNTKNSQDDLSVRQAMQIVEPEMVFVRGGTFQRSNNAHDAEESFKSMVAKENGFANWAGLQRLADLDTKAEASRRVKTLLNENIHPVTLKDFYMGKYEVTVEEYLKFADETGENYPKWLEEGSIYHIETGTNNWYKNKGYSRSATKLPVVGVSWENAKAYCTWLSSKSNRSYRLPTEAEWEYAARGGAQSKGYAYAGSNDADEVAWYAGNSSNMPHLIGGKKANELGIYDMSGNVWEWCEDSWHDNYQGAPIDGSAWTSGGKQSQRVLRSGGYFDERQSCRATFRDRNEPGHRDGSVGFRLVFQ